MPELNAFLQPVNAPITQQGQFRNSMDFDSDTDRNTVTFSKIKNFNFSSGFGGTLTLGGTENGSGELVLKRGDGSIIIIGDRFGIRGFDGNGTAVSNTKFWLDAIDTSIYDGSVSIYDINGDKSIDVRGVNSLNGFVNTQSNSESLNQEFAGASLVPITGGSLSLTVARSSNILFLYSATGFLSGTTPGLNGYVTLLVGGTELDNGLRIHLNASNLETGANHFIFTAPSAGTYTAVLNGICNPGTMTVYGFNFSYVRLGN